MSACTVIVLTLTEILLTFAVSKNPKTSLASEIKHCVLGGMKNKVRYDANL